jgi:hypothetical protein
MKNNDLKLQFIENGRLTNGEMTEILGGRDHCGSYTPCPQGETNKSSCSNYKSCQLGMGKLTCTTYINFVVGYDYTFDVAENAWIIEAI